MVMDLSGQIKMFTWNQDTWVLFWTVPRQPCDVYAFCGPYGICASCGPYGICNQSLPLCRCPPGFKPRSQRDWDVYDFSSGGCRRITPLQCGVLDKFSPMTNVSLPANGQSLAVATADACKSACLNLCSCSAYAYNNSCSIWNGDLLNLTQVVDSVHGQGDLYLRLDASGESNKSENRPAAAKLKVILPVVAAVLVLSLILGYIVFKKTPCTKGTNENQKDLELPLFDFVTIATATNNFSTSNKIGQGGFGSVYKAILPTGEEIAIKRLSTDSRQGLKEFMNEVVLISKLQHRNLVRLLGCCIHREERMLIYEYMPNKSLDFIIFDTTRSINLSWETRFNIIKGIARGLLYLHQDSRLRIIHRDLKASNVLLDRQMNPKISDFGMAKAFGGDQTEDNTRRIVGTCGYMSPEYATDGLYSMKSDVFSFGVLVLEIISGKRNRLFHHAAHDHNLLGHTWKLLNENKALELMDASITTSFTTSELLKCIQVGLLCVQKFPVDRPAMATVISILDTDGMILPSPKQPGFYTERSPCENDSTSSQDTASSKNEVTVMLLEGR